MPNEPLKPKPVLRLVPPPTRPPVAPPPDPPKPRKRKGRPSKETLRKRKYRARLKASGGTNVRDKRPGEMSDTMSPANVPPSVTPPDVESIVAMAATLAVEWIEEHEPPARQQIDITWVVTGIVFIAIAGFTWLGLHGN